MKNTLTCLLFATAISLCAQSPSDSLFEATMPGILSLSPASPGQSVERPPAVLELLLCPKDSMRTRYPGTNNMSQLETYTINGIGQLMTLDQFQYLNGLVNYKRVTYQYSGFTQVAQSLTLQSDGSGLVPTGRHSNTYNTSGKVLANSYEVFMNNAWTEKQLYENHYNAAGNLDSSLFFLTSGSQTLTPYTKDSYTYDQNSHLTAYQRVSFSPGGWTNVFKTNYTYNTSGGLLKYTTYTWNTTANQWKPGDNYDAVCSGSAVTTCTYQTWDNNTQIWKTVQRDSCMYDVDGKLLQRTSDYFYSNTWYHDFRASYLYDSRGLLLCEFQEDYSGSNWMGVYRTIYTYDPGGNLVVRLKEQTYNSAWKWQEEARSYYDCSTVGLAEQQDLPDILVFPSPAGNNLFMDCDCEIGHVEIADLQGRNIRTQTGRRELNLASLDAGIYVVMITTDKGAVRKKMIKE